MGWLMKLIVFYRTKWEQVSASYSINYNSKSTFKHKSSIIHRINSSTRLSKISNFRKNRLKFPALAKSTLTPELHDSHTYFSSAKKNCLLHSLFVFSRRRTGKCANEVLSFSVRFYIIFCVYIFLCLLFT